MTRFGRRDSRRNPYEWCYADVIHLPDATFRKCQSNKVPLVHQKKYGACYLLEVNVYRRKVFLSAARAGTRSAVRSMQSAKSRCSEVAFLPPSFCTPCQSAKIKAKRPGLRCCREGLWLLVLASVWVATTQTKRIAVPSTVSSGASQRLLLLFQGVVDHRDMHRSATVCRH